MKFKAGDRVIVKNWRHSSSHSTDMNGYFGHVVAVYNDSVPNPMVDVSLEGRIGQPPRSHDLDPHSDDPWPFFENELEHID